MDTFRSVIKITARTFSDNQRHFSVILLSLNLLDHTTHTLLPLDTYKGDFELGEMIGSPVDARWDRNATKGIQSMHGNR